MSGDGNRVECSYKRISDLHRGHQTRESFEKSMITVNKYLDDSWSNDANLCFCAVHERVYECGARSNRNIEEFSFPLVVSVGVFQSP